jgi:cytoskeletal protein RodZ
MAISEKRSDESARRRRPLLRAVAADGDESRESSVAIELAQTRLALGIDLATVAEELHIREEHLEAIEAGRFDALPGPTYVIGFLRSYARFLSLDTDRLIDQFRVESTGFAAQRKLRFPVPVDDGRIPTVPVLVFALVLVGAIGFAWYYVSDVEQVAQEGVPEVPTYLVAPPPTPTPVEAATMPPPPTDIAAALPNLQIPTAPPAEVAPAADTPVESDVAIELAELDTAAGGEAPALPLVAPDPRPAAAPVVEALAALEPVVPVEPVEPAIVATPEVAIEAPAPIVPAPVVTDGGNAPRVYGQANTDARVQLRATDETWIQVTGPGNELLLTRILKPGDIYLVPNRLGIVMMTGNAGGMEIALDGEVLPPIGPTGAVRRNIALDPEALRAYQASSP